jgi:hypothetical protein
VQKHHSQNVCLLQMNEHNLIRVVDFSDFARRYAHMMEMQERLAAVERALEERGEVPQHRQQLQRPYHFEATGKPTNSSLENDDSPYSSSDGFESAAYSADEDVADDKPHPPCADGEVSEQQTQLQTTEALAGAAREALRIDPSACDSAALAVRLQGLLAGSVKLILAQDELLQSVKPVEEPASSDSIVSRLRDSVVAAVSVARSFIQETAAVQAKLADREAQVI